MSSTRLRSLVCAIAVAGASETAATADELGWFAGGLFGVSALSADARSVTDAAGAAVSLYDPGNGPAVNLFAGAHVAEYVSIQGNWMWNRNDLTLVASSPSGGFYEQRRHSRQHAMVVDGLVYFRRRTSAVRPYLGTGLAIFHFASEPGPDARGSLTPPGGLATTRLALRSHVGIDFRLSARVAFRYSFSETISGNPIGPSLTPPGRRALMNFQNLFGVVARF